MKTIPNKITLARIILTVPFFIAMQFEGIIWGWIALVLYAIAAISDSIDGHLARKWNQVTNVGKFLDPLADKMLVDAAFICLLVRGLFPAWILLVVLVRDLAVDGIRMIAARAGETIAASYWGKSKTVVQMITIPALTLFGMYGWAWLGYMCYALEALVVIAVFASGLDYVVKGWRKYLK